MDNNTKVFEKMSNENKKIIQMYLTARQFKNSIFEDEIFILPISKNNNKCGKIKIDNLTTLYFNGNKYVTRIIPYIVNKSFACELYLKLILALFNINYNDLQTRMKHSLFELYNKLPSNSKNIIFNLYLKGSNQSNSIDFFENEIKKIEYVFMNWRYIHETIDRENTIDSGFLTWFSDVLDKYAIYLIKFELQYDVNLDIR